METDVMNEYLGRLIKDTRIMVGMSLTDASKKSKISKQALCNYESGIRAISFAKLQTLCKVYGVDVVDIMSKVQDYYIEYLKNHKENMKLWIK